MPNDKESNPNRLETVLAYMMVGVVGASIISLFVVLITGASGSTKVWPIFLVLPAIGLPLAAALIIALVIVNLRRRSRENRSNKN